jgi:hypothetical protein
MKVKEYVTYIYANGILDVYEHGKHILRQPFNSETGAGFKDQDAALAWLVSYYPNLFTPS